MLQQIIYKRFKIYFRFNYNKLTETVTRSASGPVLEQRNTKEKQRDEDRKRDKLMKRRKVLGKKPKRHYGAQLMCVCVECWEMSALQVDTQSLHLIC